jgi:hypothetical protein
MGTTVKSTFPADHVAVKAKTVLGEVEPTSEEENREWRKQMAAEWAARTLVHLLAYAEYDAKFAETVCKKVADKFGPDDRLSAVLSRRIQAERVGRPRGPNRKWTDDRYAVLLAHYHALLLDMKRDDALECLAKMEGYTGINASKQIEERITKARKVVSIDDLPEFARSPVKNNMGG